MALNSLKPLYLIINNTNGYIERNNGKMYLILMMKATTSWKSIKKYAGKLKMLDLRLANNKSGDHGEKYMKIKLTTRIV